MKKRTATIWKLKWSYHRLTSCLFGAVERTSDARSSAGYHLAVALLFVLLLGFSTHAHAQEVPRILSYQGQLLDNGQPLEGAGDVTFRLHTSPSGGSSLNGWEETKEVTFNDGVFSVVLGDVSEGGSPLPEDLVDEEELFLSVSFQGEEIDRMRLTSTVFALGAARAVTAISANRADIADSVEEDGAVTRLNTLTGELILRAEGGAEISEDEEEGSITIRAGSGGGTAGVTSIDARGGLEADSETGDVQIRIADGGVTSSKIGEGVVSNAKIADEAISERTLQDGAVTGAKVASDAISSSNLADEAVSTSKIEDGAVTGAKIGEETIESANLAPGAITTRTIEDGAVTSDKLSDDAVVTSIRGRTGAVNLRPGTGIAIEEEDEENTIRIVATGGGDDIESGVASITAGTGLSGNQSTGDVELEVSGILEEIFTAQAVETDNIADDAITNEKIASAAITSPKIQDGAVTGSKLANSAVTAEKVASNAINTNNIISQAVTGAKIANEAITSSKIADGVVLRSLNGLRDEVTLDDGTNIDIETDGSTITISAPEIGLSSVETDGAVTGDGTEGSPVRVSSRGITSGLIEFNAITEELISDGAVSENKIAENAVTTSRIADQAVTASKIGDDAVSTDQLASGAVTTDKIGSGQVTGDRLAEDAAVLSLNNLSGGIDLVGGGDIDISDNGNDTITISVNVAAGALTEVFSDGTLDGDGTEDQPLSVNEIGSELIASDAITNDELADDAVDGDNIQDGSIVRSIDGVQDEISLAGAGISIDEEDGTFTFSIGAEAVGAAQLAEDAVGTENIQDEAITAAKLDEEAAVLSLNELVGDVQLIGGGDVEIDENENEITISVDVPEGVLMSVNTDEETILGDGTDTDQLRVGTIDAAQIADNAITSDELAANAVDTDNIQNNAITTAKIASGQVTGDELADGAVDTGQLADEAVTEAKIAEDAVTETELADGTAIRSITADGQTLFDGVTFASSGDADISVEGSTITFSATSEEGGLQEVATDDTLDGDGTPDDELGVANNAIGTDQLANETAVRSLNGLQDVLSLVDGSGIAISDNDSDEITIAVSEIDAGQIASGEVVFGVGVEEQPLLTDEVEFAEGSGIELSQSGQVITISATGDNGETAGVESLNGLEGFLSIDSGNESIDVSASGSTIDLAIAPGSITSTELAENAVDNNALGSDAVDTENILNDAITTAKIGENQVTGNEIADQAVDTGQLALEAVTSAILDDDAAVVGLRANTDDFLVNEVTIEGGTDIELVQDNTTRTITINSTASGNGETAGVESLNNLTGALDLVSGDGSIGIDPNDEQIDLSIADDAVGTEQLVSGSVTSDILAPNAAVTSLQAEGGDELVGGVVLIGGDDINLSQDGQEITINSTASGNGGTAGVESLNDLEGELSLVGDGIISIEPDAVEDELSLSIADNSITAAQIQAASITDEELAADAVTSTELAGETAVTSLNSLQDDVSIVSTDESVSIDPSGDTIDLSVEVEGLSEVFAEEDRFTGDGTEGDPLDIAENAITTTHLAEDAVESINIGANQVTSSELADNAVETDNILNEAVTAEKLAEDAAVLSISDGTTTTAGDLQFTSDGTIIIDADEGEGTVEFSVDENELSGQTSAARYKEAVEKLENPAELLAQLRGVRYQWVEDGRADVGMIADEVAEVLPELVTFNDAGEPERLHYARLVAVLVEAAKEQQDEIDAQQEQIDEMEERIARLERMVTQMAEAGN